MFGLKDYVISGLVLAVVGTGVWGKAEQQRAIRATIEVTKLAVALKTCATQVETIRADLESDNAIDNLSNADLVDVPDEWLRGE